jgi:hypothetical protein
VGGEHLKSVDISTRDKVFVTMDNQGRVAVHDGFGWCQIESIEGDYKDISCGLKNDDETIAIIQ